MALHGGAIGKSWKRIQEIFSRENLRDIAAPSNSDEGSCHNFGFGDYPALVEDFAHFQTVLEQTLKKLQPETCVALSGEAGVGKTSLAHKIARHLRYEDGKIARHIFLISADTPENLRWNLAQLATKKYFNLGISLPEPSAQNRDHASDDRLIDKAIEKVKEKLSSIGNWLMVFDNMDDYFYKDGRYRYEEVKRYFPSLKKGGRILITTLDQGENIAHGGLMFQAVDRLSPQEGAKFLLKRIGCGESPAQLEQAKQISEELSGLLLTLDQAAAHIGERIHDVDTRYTLQEYLSDYARTGRELRARDPRGSHKPITITVEMALGKLCDPDNDNSQKLVASLLLTCAFLHPDQISLKLLQGFQPEGFAQPPSREEIEASATRAKKLRLLTVTHSDNGMIIRIHREVRAVLQDILKPDANTNEVVQTPQQEALGARARNDWPLAMKVLEQALDRHEFSAELSSHLDTLLENEDIEKQLALSTGVTPPTASYPALSEQMVQRNVLKAIKNGDSWETLLFGSATPSYEAMHRLQDQEEEKKVKWRMAAIRQVCGEKFGRVVFSCVYLVIHYWWDTYLEGDYLAKPLLDHWDEQSEDDKTLLKNLRVLQEHYPPVHDYKNRANQTEDWNKIGKAILELRKQLEIEPLAENATSAERFARAITNFHLAEALRYGNELEGCNPLENQKSWQLNREAETLFAENADEFHRIWALWEMADYHGEAGQRCRSYAQANPQQAQSYQDKGRDHFETAREICFDGLAAAIERAHEDAIDAEVVAGFYSLLADISAAEAEDAGTAHEVVAYRCAACFLAYAFILHEADSYSVAFYDEQSKRMMDWLNNGSPAQRLERCKYLQQFWKRQILDDEALADLDLNSLECHTKLFPNVPKLVGSTKDAELNSVDETHIKRLIHVMPRQIERLQAAYPLDLTTPETSTLSHVAALLIKQLEKMPKR